MHCNYFPLVFFKLQELFGYTCVYQSICSREMYIHVHPVMDPVMKYYTTMKKLTRVYTITWACNYRCNVEKDIKEQYIANLSHFKSKQTKLNFLLMYIYKVAKTIKKSKKLITERIRYEDSGYLSGREEKGPRG